MDPKSMRLSDSERTAAADQLAAHFAAGRLTSAEYDERCQAAFTAVYLREVDALFADLPALPPGAALRTDSPLPAVLPDPSLPFSAASRAVNRIPGKVVATRTRDTRRLRLTAFFVLLLGTVFLADVTGSDAWMYLSALAAVVLWIPNWDGVHKDRRTRP